MKDSQSKTQDCKVVHVDGDKLTTACSDGTERSYTVAKDAKVTCNGQTSQIADLKAGARIRVTPCKDDENLARVVESRKELKAMAGTI